MSNEIKVWERLEWDHSGDLEISDRFRLILGWFIKECDLNGRFTAFIRAWASRTCYSEEELERALEEFVGLGLLVHYGKDPKTAFPMYELVHGATVTPQQLTFDQHRMVELIEAIPDISNTEQLVLEKLVMKHFDWAQGLVVATTEDLVRLPVRWKERWRRAVIQGLIGKGYLTRKHRRGYRDSPHVYVLTLPDIRHYTAEFTPENGTILPNSPPENGTILPNSPPENGTILPNSPPENGTILPNSNTSSLLEEQEERREELSTTATAVAADSDSEFLSRVWELAGEEAADFMWVEDIEEQSVRRWHWSRADELLDDFDRFDRNPRLHNPMGMLRSEWARKVRYVDMSTPSGVDLSPQDEESDPLVVYDRDPDPEATRIWQEASEMLRMQVTRPNYEIWIRVVQGMEWDGQVLTIGCPNAFVAEMIEQRMYSLVAQSVADVVQAEADVKFAVYAQPEEES